MPFDFGEPQDDPLIRAKGSSALPATFDAGVGSFVDLTLDNIAAVAYRNLDFNTRNVSAGFGRGVQAGGDAERYLSAEEANATYGADGLLTFEGGVAESVAKERRDLAMRAARRQSVYERSDLGLVGNVLGFGANVASSFTDPISVAASFIPVVSQARYAKWLEGTSSWTSRAAIRGSVGALEGVVGQAAIEPLLYGMTRAEGRDYSMADSLFNIAVGGVFGGGLHTSLGAIGDWAGGPPSYRNPTRAVDMTADASGAPKLDFTTIGEGPRPRDATIERVRRADPETRMEAIATAIEQDARDEPIDVAPVFEKQEAKAGAAAEKQSAALPDLAMRPVRDDVAFTPTGRRIDVTYAIAELDSLVASHDDAMRINPKYPAALQPRDRTRMASEAQIGEMARKLEPKLLMEGSGADGGAPIVSEKGEVESGNGRIIALRRAAKDGPKGAAYRAALIEAGLDVDGYKQPVLVRVRRTALEGADRIAFTREANERATAALSAPEQAIADAKAISDAALALHRGGTVALIQNRDFVKAAIEAIAGQAEQGLFFTRDGNLSADGAARLERALLARAYDDPDLVTLMTEAGMDDVRAIGGAMVDLAAQWAQMRAKVRDGVLKREADQTAALTQAVMLVRRARRDGRPVSLYIRTDDMFGGGLPPEVEAFTAIFFRDGQLTKPAGRESIKDALDFYLTEAGKMDAGPSLFGGLDGGQPIDILGAAVARRGGESGQLQLSIRPGAESAGGNGQAPQPDGGQPGSRGDGGAPGADRGSQGGDVAAPPPLLGDMLADRRAKEPSAPKPAPDPGVPPSPALQRVRADAEAIRTELDAARALLQERIAQIGPEIGLDEALLLDMADADLRAEAVQAGDVLLADGTDAALQKISVEQKARDAAVSCLSATEGLL